MELGIFTLWRQIVTILLDGGRNCGVFLSYFLFISKEMGEVGIMSGTHLGRCLIAAASRAMDTSPTSSTILYAFCCLINGLKA